MVSLYRSFLIFISIFIYFDDQSLADESISFDTNINAPFLADESISFDTNINASL